MKRTALLSVLIAAGLGTAAFASAQAAGPIGGPPPVEVQKVSKGPLVIEREVIQKLSLSEPQIKQVRDLLVKLGKDFKALRKENKAQPDKLEMRQKQLALRKTYLESLKTILTPEQMTQYEQLHKELRKKREEAKKTPPAP